MKRPRFAVSLILGAMVALISMDGFPPVERGVAADLSDNSADLLCPADFPHASNTGVFQWFEHGGKSRSALPAAEPMDASPTITSLEADEFYIATTIEQANFITSLYRTLMNNFAFFGEVVTEPDFNYGAPNLAAEKSATGNEFGEQQVALSCEIALGWRGVPALNWMSECDICPNYSVIATPDEAVEAENVASQAGDLSDMVLEIRELSTDGSLELNAVEQGVGETSRIADADVDESIFPVVETYSEFIATVDGGFAVDAIRRPESSISDTDLSEACTEATVEATAEFKQAPLRPRAPLECAQFDCWIDEPLQRGCPLLEEAASDLVVAAESDDAVAGAPLDTSEQWPGCDLHSQRGDFAWYYKQQQLGEAITEVEQGPIAGDIDPEQAARLSGGLSIAASSVAAVLSNFSERLEELSQEAMCQADRMRRNRSQATKPAPRKSTTSRSEVIFKEI